MNNVMPREVTFKFLATVTSATLAGKTPDTSEFGLYDSMQAGDIEDALEHINKHLIASFSELPDKIASINFSVETSETQRENIRKIAEDAIGDVISQLRASTSTMLAEMKTHAVKE